MSQKEDAVPVEVAENLATYLDSYIARCDAAGTLFAETRAVACAALTHVRSIASGRAGDPDAARLRLAELVAKLAAFPPP
jgi:hypothetical protein